MLLGRMQDANARLDKREKQLNRERSEAKRVRDEAQMISKIVKKEREEAEMQRIIKME